MSGRQAKPASFHRSPKEAMQAVPEELLYLACLHAGTRGEAPDFIAVVDAEDGRIVRETPMPNVGDELHHFGWNRCSSACHGPDRSHLIVPGFRSSRIHVLNVADDPRAPHIEKVIERQELVAATGYTRPHTVHCMPGDNVVISMLGDADGNGAGGFAVLDAKTFELEGRWENGGETPRFNYDFWYQPRKNVLVSSEFGAPNAYEPGYPGLRSWLFRVDCKPDGGMEVDPDFFLDLHDRPGGATRAHEVRLQGGDCTTEIFQ